MPSLVPFEEVEAIILLNICQFIITSDITKNSMLLSLSRILRNLAKNKGFTIDDSYRSPSGLNYQTNVMFKYISDFESTRVPKIFIAATNLYKQDNIAFRKKLWEGLLMASDSNKQTFLKFLTLHNPQAASEIFWSLEKADEYLLTNGLIQRSLYEGMTFDVIVNIESIIKNDKIFANKFSNLTNFLDVGFSMIKKYIAAYDTSEDNSTTISLSDNQINESQLTIPKFAPQIVDQCLTLIKEKFPNGIKKSTGIAKRKFLAAYFEKYNIDFPYDADYDVLLSQITLEYADKYYAIDDNLISFIREQLDAYSVDNEMIFFYSTFYNTYISEFSQLGIYSDEMLKAVLKKEFHNYFYYTNYFATRRGLTIEQVVNSAFGEKESLSIDDLKGRLPFIECKQILPVLSRTGSGYIRVENGRYILTKEVKISQSDVERSKKIIDNDLLSQGYSFTTSLIVEDSEFDNPEINRSALQLILFDNNLSNDYSRNRTLIAPLGEAISIKNVLINYCKQHNKITLQEIEEYETDLTGEDKARRSLNAAVSAMIRVDKEIFIDHIDFNTEAVDKAIEPFIGNRKIISLKNVTSFSTFPDVEEYAWNSFLLASYLRHYSKRWGYMGDEAKKKSVGVIFDKKQNYDSYDDALAQAVASSGIELIQEDVSYFLIHNEYRLRTTDFKDIISKAYQIRMREE